jgi:hypothetical protein
LFPADGVSLDIRRQPLMNDRLAAIRVTYRGWSQNQVLSHADEQSKVP